MTSNSYFQILFYVVTLIALAKAVRLVYGQSL